MILTIKGAGAYNHNPNYEKANLLMEGLSNYCFKNMGTVNESKIIRKYTGVF